MGIRIPIRVFQGKDLENARIYSVLAKFPIDQNSAVTVVRTMAERSSREQWQRRVRCAIVPQSFLFVEYCRLSISLTSHRCLVSLCGQLIVWLALVSTAAGAAPSPTSEFDSPYQLRVLSDGTVLEVSGSFSWALPQNFQAVLASAPQVRVVRFDSPGGHIQPALDVALMIRQRGLDTYVGRFCASACTLAYLGGRQRWLAPDARLAFHQGHAPGIPPTLVNTYLREAYEKFAVPAPFIAHVLRIAPDDLWIPTHDELRAARYTTGDPPATIIALDQGQSRSLRDVTRMLKAASDGSITQLALALSDLLERLHDVNPEACWAFAHDGPADLKSLLPGPVLDAVSAAERRVAEDATTTRAAAQNVGERRLVAADLIETMRARGQSAALNGLRSGADHAAFCPALRDLVQAALALPETRRARALRAVLSGD
jgi:hypothetical protein